MNKAKDLIRIINSITISESSDLYKSYSDIDPNRFADVIERALSNIQPVVRSEGYEEVNNMAFDEKLRSQPIIAIILGTKPDNNGKYDRKKLIGLAQHIKSEAKRNDKWLVAANNLVNDSVFIKDSY